MWLDAASFDCTHVQLIRHGTQLYTNSWPTAIRLPVSVERCWGYSNSWSSLFARSTNLQVEFNVKRASTTFPLRRYS